jgi:hypothetical protein
LDEQIWNLDKEINRIDQKIKKIYSSKEELEFNKAVQEKKNMYNNLLQSNKSLEKEIFSYTDRL